MLLQVLLHDLRAIFATGPLTLPQCDDDTPGQPVTGTCWLADDGTVAVWPRPYADTPLLILGGSQ